MGNITLLLEPIAYVIVKIWRWLESDTGIVTPAKKWR